MIAMPLGMTDLTGCACGLLNGTLISATKVVPFIVTLGTMTIFLGVGQIIANESTVYAPRENIPEWLKYFCYTGSGGGKLFDSRAKIPHQRPGCCRSGSGGRTLLMRYTVFGQKRLCTRIERIDGADLCGINVPLTIVSVYTLAGFFVAIGGLLYFADVKNGNPTDGHRQGTRDHCRGCARGRQPERRARVDPRHGRRCTDHHGDTQRL